MLLLVAAAAAHSPHDVAPFVAVGPDGTLFTADTELLTWTHDAGATWDFRYLDAGTPTCGRVDGTGFTVGTEENGVWHATDGLEWTAEVGPAHVLACADGVWAGEEGLWIDGVQVLADPVVDVADRAAALLVGGEVALAPDWTRTGAAARPTCVALDGDAPVVGSSLSELMRWDGAAWVAVAGSPVGVQTLVIDGDTWLAGTDREGVFVSTDGGVGWALDATGFETINDGPGSPPDGVHFLDLAIVDGVWYSAQWEGVWWKRPEDHRWQEGTIDIVPRTRGVEWVGEALLGAVYGGGVYRGIPGTPTWEVASRGVSWPYPKQVLQRGEDLFLVSGSILYRSRDGGLHWEDLPLGADDVGDHVAVAPDYPTHPVVMAGARKDGVGGAFVSLDAGETWTWSPVGGVCSEKPANIASDGTTTWMACGYQGELYRSEDWGQHWTLAQTIGVNIWDILAEDPPLLATERGLLRAGDSVETLALEGVDVDQVLRGPDGQLWATAPGSGLYRVDDTTGVATPTGWPLLDRVEELAIREDGVFAVGTRKGIFTSPDGQTWTRANQVEFLDDPIQFWWFEGDWASEGGEAYNGAKAQSGGEGAHAELDWAGEQVRIWGDSPNGARVRFTLDGVASSLSLDAGTPYGVLFAADTPAGTHRLSVDVDGGHVVIDTAEVWRADAPPLAADDSGGTPIDPGPCGCGGGKQAALLGLLGPWLRRRRSAAGPPG